MTSARRRIQLIAGIMIFVGSLAWVNAIGTFMLTSSLNLNAEMVLLFAGIGLFRHHGRRARFALWLILVAAIVVILIPVTAFTISPRVTVSLFGDDLTPTSPLALALVIGLTFSYVATLGWLYFLIRRDLHFEPGGDD